MYKVMIVEDEDVTVKMLNYLLRKDGYSVTAYSNGQEAVEALEKDKPDLILMDVMMPKMNGIEATAYIKKDNRFKDIPLIMLSALGQESEVSAGLEAGADEYVVKPFDSNSLLRLIRSKLI